MDFTWFKPKEHSTAFKKLQPGCYKVMISGAIVKKNKAGTGFLLVLTYTVIGDSSSAGRTALDFINIRHENKMAQQIGLDTLGDVCAAVGLDELPTETALLNKILKITTDIDDRDQVRITRRERFVSELEETLKSAKKPEPVAVSSESSEEDDIPF